MHEATLEALPVEARRRPPSTRSSAAAPSPSPTRPTAAGPTRRPSFARPWPAGGTWRSPTAPCWPADLASLGRILLKQSRWSEAEPLLRESLAIRVKTIPDD